PRLHPAEPRQLRHDPAALPGGQLRRAARDHPLLRRLPPRFLLGRVRPVLVPGRSGEAGRDAVPGAGGDAGVSGADRPGTVVPAQYQPDLPVDRFILKEGPGAEAVPMDVVFVGGGPAGLSGAIELARLVKRDTEAGGTLGDVQIGVLEKASALGE